MEGRTGSGGDWLGKVAVQGEEMEGRGGAGDGDGDGGVWLGEMAGQGEEVEGRG